ncbi:hypothetical protein M378DRAFT_169018 [Amanita muscaria Koide BX008]|uniref:Uncharacterized protein n=1 Tax=Amanita muscaria (strain Koide BX008) TaxID=946122 RepID=A0A0C2SZQ0_AMAMK|nr:hypothetical protein M378DRAFT_169018 [Amanita muscaria Koide BX008]
MSQSSNAISPCGRLNDDVLREIFIHCIRMNNHSDSYYLKNVSECFEVNGHCKPSIRALPQLSVSQVCPSWRDIALRTRQLWDNISIPDLTEANLSIAKEYLSRAGDAPISMKIELLESAPHYLALTNFLSSYRLRSLWLCSNIQPLFLLRLPQRSVASLEFLAVFTSDFEEASLDLNDIRYPKLGVVYVWGTIKISGFNNSLRKFHALSIPMTVIESWDLLDRFPSLEEAELTLQFDGSRSPVSRPQIHLQRLRILALYSKSETFFSTFIKALSLPVLEELRLRSRVAWPATAFQSLAHRSNYFPHLREFHLADSTSIINAGILLTSMPWLKSISLCPCYNIIKVRFDDLVLNGLASGSLTPRLQSLRVGPILNKGCFLDMVESRMRHAQMSTNGVPAPFTEVVFLATFDDDDSNRLLDMRERGIVRDYSMASKVGTRREIIIDGFEVR